MDSAERETLIDDRLARGLARVGRVQGLPAMLEQWRRIKGAWAEDRVEVGELESIGDGVLGCLQWITRGNASGAPVEVAILYEFDHERFSKMTYFLDRESARMTAEANG